MHFARRDPVGARTCGCEQGFIQLHCDLHTQFHETKKSYAIPKNWNGAKNRTIKKPVRAVVTQAFADFIFVICLL